MFCFVNGSPKLVLNPLRVFDGVKWGIYFIAVCEWVYLLFFFPVNVLMS